MSLFGMLINALRRRTGTLKVLFFLALAALAAANIFVRPPEAEYGLDAYPEFWAAFGLFGGLAMVILMKKIVQPMIRRREDFYDRRK